MGGEGASDEHGRIELVPPTPPDSPPFLPIDLVVGDPEDRVVVLEVLFVLQHRREDEVGDDGGEVGKDGRDDPPDPDDSTPESPLDLSP